MEPGPRGLQRAKNTCLTAVKAHQFMEQLRDNTDFCQHTSESDSALSPNLSSLQSSLLLKARLGNTTHVELRSLCYSSRQLLCVPQHSQNPNPLFPPPELARCGGQPPFVKTNTYELLCGAAGGHELRGS